MERDPLGLVGIRIKSFRKLRGYTQKEFAQKMGVSLSIIGAVERGMRRLDRRLMLKVLTTLEIDETELLERTPQQTETADRIAQW